MPKRSPPKQSGKPARQAVQARSLATVEAILEAAARILAEAGWAALNTNIIAKRAGVSIGSIYEYFPDKRAIVDEILNRHLARGEALFRESANDLNSGPQPVDIVRVLVSGFVTLHRDDPHLHQVLSSEVALTLEQKMRVAALRANTIKRVTLALADHSDNPHITATLLVDTADALSHRWLVDAAGTPASEKIMTNELQKMLYAYLTCEP